LQEQLEAIPVSEDKPITIDFKDVLEFDATAGEMIVDMVSQNKRESEREREREKKERKN